MSQIKLNQTGLSIPIRVVKVGEPPYDGDGWDDSKPYYLVDGADGTVLCGVTESLKKAFEYMAQCVNSHDTLLAALKNIELDAHGGVTYGKMEKALIQIAASAQEAYNKPFKEE